MIGSGCHKITGPTGNTNPLDSNIKQVDSGYTQLGTHYTSMRVNFKNVIMSGHDYYYTESGGSFNNSDTTLRSSNSSVHGVSWDHDHSLVVDSGTKISIYKGFIPNLSGYFNHGTIFGTLQATFLNVSFKYLPDSTIYIELNGLDTGKHINQITDYYYEDHYPTSRRDNYRWIEEIEHTIYRTTDSTVVVVTIGKN